MRPPCQRLGGTVKGGVVMDEQNILETQLILGKQVLEIVLDLLKDDSKIGVVLPLNINDHDFTMTIEKEVID